VNESIKNVTAAMASLGTQSQGIEAQIVQNAKTQDVVRAGVGNLIDADMAKESASLQAGQVKQQLVTKALSIANAAPQWISKLFQ
jgi:flagellin